MVFYIIRSLPPPFWWVICVYIYRVDFAWVDSFDGNIHRWENFPSSKITISKYVKAPNDKNTERRKRKRTRVSASHFSIQFFLFLLLRVFRYKVIPTQFSFLVLRSLCGAKYLELIWYERCLNHFCTVIEVCGESIDMGENERWWERERKK